MSADRRQDAAYGLIVLLSLVLLIVLSTTDAAVALQARGVDALQLASAAAAAGFGAWAAFRLEAAHAERREQKGHAAAIREVMFMLTAQHNVLANVKMNILDQWVQHPHRSVLMPPTGELVPTPTADTAKVLFLLETGHGHVPADVEFAILQYHEAAGALAYRNRLHVEFQNRLEAQDVGREIVLEELPDQVGRGLFKRLHDTTEGVFNNWTAAIRSSAVALQGLVGALESEFPGEHVPRVTFVNERGERVTPNE